jgi:general secretion pathway protein K
MMRRRSQGIALVSVLWLLVLLTTIAVALTTTVRSEVRAVGNTVEMTRARYAAQAGVELGVLNLLIPQVQRHPTDGTVRELALPDVTVRIATRDEAGKVDLNHASAEVLIALLVQAGVEMTRASAIADAILDWRDADDLRRLNGAEDADYRIAGRGYGAADSRFHAVDELQRVLGMEPDIFAAIEPALTVYSGLAATNPQLASPQVVNAISGLPAAQTSASGLSFTIHVEAETATGIMSRVAATVALVPGNAGRPYQVLAWRQLQAAPFENQLPGDALYAGNTEGIR